MNLILISVRTDLCVFDARTKGGMVGDLGKSLRLPGSHGHIFPWDPPSFGVPDNVLEEMAKRLQEKILKCAVENLDQDKSQQSSPTSTEFFQPPMKPPRVGFSQYGI